jgi:hypothetical protein
MAHAIANDPSANLATVRRADGQCQQADGQCQQDGSNPPVRRSSAPSTSCVMPGPKLRFEAYSWQDTLLNRPRKLDIYELRIATLTSKTIVNYIDF